MLNLCPYRTCIPAEAEPTLNSSSCYPLVNFTRPFCQNHGIALPNYVYKTPGSQYWRNGEDNKIFDGFEKFGPSKINLYFNVNTSIATIRKCGQAVIIFFCHEHFPSCDRTQSIFRKQTLCRESCLDVMRICGKLYQLFFKYYTIQFPETKKKYRCELQPYRNAGDSPECSYLTELANVSGNIVGSFSTAVALSARGNMCNAPRVLVTIEGAAIDQRPVYTTPNL